MGQARRKKMVWRHLLFKKTDATKSTPTPTEFVEKFMGFAREQIEQGDELRPIAYRFGVNGDIEAMPVSTASQFDKNKTAIFLCALTKLPSTACVIFFTGAWGKPEVDFNDPVRRLKSVTKQ